MILSAFAVFVVSLFSLFLGENTHCLQKLSWHQWCLHSLSWHVGSAFAFQSHWFGWKLSFWKRSSTTFDNAEDVVLLSLKQCVKPLRGTAVKGNLFQACPSCLPKQNLVIIKHHILYFSWWLESKIFVPKTLCFANPFLLLSWIALKNGCNL